MNTKVAIAICVVLLFCLGSCKVLSCVNQDEAKWAKAAQERVRVAQQTEDTKTPAQRKADERRAIQEGIRKMEASAGQFGRDFARYQRGEAILKQKREKDAFDHKTLYQYK
jgi:hypothetical protein